MAGQVEEITYSELAKRLNQKNLDLLKRSKASVSPASTLQLINHLTSTALELVRYGPCAEESLEACHSSLTTLLRKWPLMPQQALQYMESLLQIRRATKNVATAQEAEALLMMLDHAQAETERSRQRWVQVRKSAPRLGR